MSVQINFDSSQVQPSTGQLDAMPAGWYNVMMDESELKPTKDGNGAYLSLRFNVADGTYAGRKLYSRLNIRNANPQAVEIAYRDLAAICHAVGAVGMVQDTAMLHGRPLKVKVKVRPASADYEASNDITAYRNINDTSAVNAPAGGVNPGMPTSFPPQQPQQPQWQPQGGAQQPAQGQGTTYAPQPQQQAPQGGGWQPPAGGQPWQQPQQPPMQPQPQQQQFPQQPMQQPMQQQPAPQQQFAQPQQPMQQPQQQPGVNPMGNQPPPWAQA